MNGTEMAYIYIYNYICVHTHNMSLLMGKIMMNDSMFASQVFRQKKHSVRQKDDNRKLLFCLIACRSTFLCSKGAK